MATSLTQTKNDIPFEPMRKLVRFVLFTMIFMSLSFTTGFAQESSIANNGSEHHILPIEPDSIIIKFRSCLSRLDPKDYPKSDDFIEEYRQSKENQLPVDEYWHIRLNPIPLGLDSAASDEECEQALTSKLDKIRNDQIKLMKKHENDKHKLVSIIVFISCALIIGCLAVIVIRVLFSKKKSKAKNGLPKQPVVQPVVTPSAGDTAGIEIRNVTTIVLQKQSLEDVVNNENYFCVEGKDFSDNTAIGRMYIKNVCIKGIYDMYAEDIRKSENPNENGCMVLGRWVYDPKSDKYDVSLEELVFPGDDAAFSQDEIRFGGKIKMKIYEKLKKLRQDTGLQYDVTCWVHSHPKLTVFFSNSDCNVQLQLRHPTHPNFLTAIVVDILTPTQELGIFTFQQDGSINSKVDLKRLYSLKEWNSWAMGCDNNSCENNSIRNEDYYNTLSEAQNRDVSCHDILLSDKAITDICDSTFNNDESLQMIHGVSRQNANGETSLVADSLSETIAVPDSELVGAFVVDMYCSIPSVRKLVADYLDKIKFVLVYSSSNKTLTSIPVINNDLCEETSYYGEQKLKDINLWKKRKE